MSQWSHKVKKIDINGKNYEFDAVFNYPSIPFTIPSGIALPDFCSINSLKIDGKECTLEEENDFVKWCKLNLKYND